MIDRDVPGFPADSTASLVLRALKDGGWCEPVNGMPCPPPAWSEANDTHGAGWVFRFNAPWRTGSDSFSCAVIVHDDVGEYGAFVDFVDDSYQGSLYQLAMQLGIDPPHPERRTSKAYASLADYASDRGVPADAFIRAGWKEQERLCPKTRVARPALTFPTKNGVRARFIDGLYPKYSNPKGFEPCWYGLARAVQLAAEQDMPLILANGEASTVAAQWHGVPAFARAGGTEKRALPRNLLDQLRDAYPDGPILVALDCDKAGRRASPALADQLRREGWEALSIDFGEADGFDLADYSALHQGQTNAMLRNLAAHAQAVLNAPAQDDAADPSLLSPLHVERQSLAILLYHPDKILELGSTWSETWYSSEAHRVLARILRTMTAKHALIDHVTVWQKICEQNKHALFGSQKAVQQWRDEGLDAAGLPEYLRVIEDATMRRQWLQAIFDLQRAARDPNIDVRSLRSKAELALVATAPVQQAAGVLSMQDALEKIWNAMSGDVDPVVMTNIPPLDRAIAGLVKGDLLVVAARPGGGKTALTVHMALEWAIQGYPVLYFSQEVDPMHLTARVISAAIQSGGFRRRFQPGRLVDIPYSTIIKNRMDDQQLQSFIDVSQLIPALPIYVIGGKQTMATIMHETRKLSEQIGEPVIPIVDYIQYIEWPAGVVKESEAVGKNAYALKSLADADYVRFVAACCQMNRGVEGRGGDEPRMSDVEGSGKIEQAATNLVIAMPVKGEEREKRVAKQVLEVLKARNGAIGTFVVGYDRGNNFFTDLESDEPYG